VIVTISTVFVTVKRVCGNIGPMQTTARVARSTPPSRPHHAAAGLAPALGLALAPLVALGFSRFAYALLLPAMQQEFGWSFAQAGSLNTANAAGYLRQDPRTRLP